MSTPVYAVPMKKLHRLGGVTKKERQRRDAAPSKVDALCSLFGSQRALAGAVAVDPAIISRWRPRGLVPAEYNVRILGAALERGIDFAAVNECLDKTCPKCGQPWEG